MRYLFGQESESIKPVISERRYFLHNAMNLGTIGIAATITGCGFIAARRYPKTVDVSVPLKNLPQDLVGLKIVQISDLHVGSTIKRDYVSEVVKRVNGLDPDIVVLTGDLADGSVSWLGKDVSPLGALRSRFGNYFVTGNHEYYSGVGPWLKEVQRLGFEVLLNEHRVIRKGAGRLVLAGVTDFNAGRMMGSHASNPAASLNDSPDCDLKVLLAHQPRSLFEAARAGFDLQISGHTHGGQYFPVNLLARLANPYLAGLHKHGDTWIYVNRGTGYWGPPMRTGSISEITSLTLISA
ncbi:MAG: metallophosphoesterase [Proteobacteria bacterium]|nr:metallophosphoesterase [Pseudomonadota bacterium]